MTDQPICRIIGSASGPLDVFQRDDKFVLRAVSGDEQVCSETSLEDVRLRLQADAPADRKGFRPAITILTPPFAA